MTVERIEQEHVQGELELRVDPPVVASMLQQFAVDARAAYTVAQSIAKTTFVPTSYKRRGGRGNYTYLEPEEVAQNVTAAFLAGAEIGLKPMQALQAINIIEGTPALSALAMRALVTAAGHEVWIHEQSLERQTMMVTMRGRRRGSDTVQEVTWTLGRARQAGLLEKDNWQKDPLAMLIARCSSALCRIIGADVLMGLAYSVEELGDEGPMDPEEVRELTGSSERGQGAAPASLQRKAAQVAAEPVVEPVVDAEVPELGEPVEPVVEHPEAEAEGCVVTHEDGRVCRRQAGHEGKHYFGPKGEAGGEPVEPVAPVAGEPVDDAPGPDSEPVVGEFVPTPEELAEQDADEPMFEQPTDEELAATYDAEAEERAKAAAAAAAQVEQVLSAPVEPAAQEPAAAQAQEGKGDGDDDPWADFR